MSYRPTEFEVNNSGGIGCDIRIDPETIAGGTMFFQVEQDSESVTVSLECLENLLACANKLLQGWRETRSDAQTHTQKSAAPARRPLDCRVRAQAVEEERCG